MKITEGARTLAFVNNHVSLPTPLSFATNFSPATGRKDALTSRAKACDSDVLPVPGEPYSNKPAGIDLLDQPLP
ncbi:hypothetical protein Tco_0443894, partial [Tanacetum coccineum]